MRLRAFKIMSRRLSVRLTPAAMPSTNALTRKPQRCACAQSCRTSALMA